MPPDSKSVTVETVCLVWRPDLGPCLRQGPLFHLMTTRPFLVKVAPPIECQCGLDFLWSPQSPAHDNGKCEEEQNGSGAVAKTGIKRRGDRARQRRVQYPFAVER